LESSGNWPAWQLGGRAIVGAVRHSWPPTHAVRAIRGVAEGPLASEVGG
jgi:hypothetical protein